MGDTHSIAFLGLKIIFQNQHLGDTALAGDMRSCGSHVVAFLSLKSLVPLPFGVKKIIFHTQQTLWRPHGAGGVSESKNLHPVAFWG